MRFESFTPTTGGLRLSRWKRVARNLRKGLNTASFTLSSSTISRAIKFIQAEQRADGSWFGSWGVCFTYAAWFGLEGLACGGESYENRYARDIAV